MGNNPYRPSSKGGSQNSERRTWKSRKKGTSKSVRNKLLREWRGGIDPPSPVRNIHQPSEFLAGLLKSVGLSDGIDEGRLKDSWSKVAGEFVSKHTVPESLRGGVLVLLVLQPTMKFHLQQMRGKLLDNMRRELGDGVVKQIVFKIG
jgi:predicted nucleic acid-binding Zn ribbon protein